MNLIALSAAFRKLLVTGFSQNEDDALQLLQGIAHPIFENSTEASGWVISQRLLVVRPQLAGDEELICALLALLPEVRQAWLRIAAARCREAGQMQDAAVLLQLVSGLKAGAAWVADTVPRAELVASPYASLERELLGTSLEQAAGTPALIRILAVAASLAQFQKDALPTLPRIDASGSTAQTNWTRGRLLALPQTRGLTNGANSDYLLHGNFGVVSGNDDASPMSWVLANPWALLLAMVAYAQYNWAAEARGGLLLELSSGQNPFSPSEIIVLVQGPDGDEIQCGSLASLLLRSLAHIGVACFPYWPTAAELNTSLGPIIAELLNRQVWRFQEGASGQHGQYQIHPSFADACFSLPGCKVFTRNGSLLWQAIRIQAEQWRDELRPALIKRAIA